MLDKVQFKCQDFKFAKIAEFNVIFMFGVNSAMANLEHRIKTEAQPDSFVVCYRFGLKERKPIHKNLDLHIYLVENVATEDDYDDEEEDRVRARLGWRMEKL